MATEPVTLPRKGTVAWAVVSSPNCYEFKWSDYGQIESIHAQKSDADKAEESLEAQIRERDGDKVKSSLYSPSRIVSVLEVQIKVVRHRTQSRASAGAISLVKTMNTQLVN